MSVNKSRSEIGEQYNICQNAVIGPDVKIGMNSLELENVFHTINNSFFWNPVETLQNKYNLEQDNQF